MTEQITVDRKAVQIAAIIMQAAELCRYDDISKCRRRDPYAPMNDDCVKCIEKWLLQKAKTELRREGKK